MGKKLGLIAVAGLVAAVILLGVAWRLTGNRGVGEMALRLAEWRLPRCAEPFAGHTTSRDLAWTGGDSVAIGVPAAMHYQPGTGDKLTVTGDTSILRHVYIDQGEIKLDCRSDHPGALGLDIALPGNRSFRSYSLTSLTSLSLSGIDQSDLHFNLAGSSKVTASGRVDSVRVNGAGRSEAQLGALAAREAHLNLVGASNVEEAATDRVEVNAVGAVTVTLRVEPRSLQTNIVGKGRMVHGAP